LLPDDATFELPKIGEIMKKLLLIVFAMLFLLPAGSLRAAEQTPTEDLKPVLKDLTDVLADQSLKGNPHRSERRAKIMSLIKRGFDFQEMSKRVLGKTWQDIDDKEREHFTTLMTKLLENVYIGKLESYSGQSIEYAAENVKDGRAQVSTFLDNNGTKIPIHYIMHKTPERWMVYDINIEGVSLVRNYQEQFKSILRQDKYEGLVKVLEDKNRSFETEAK
jgi:phospholipid transport system substrate-binding protein